MGFRHGCLRAVVDVELLGTGSYGEVAKAVHTPTGQVVAINRAKCQGALTEQPIGGVRYTPQTPRAAADLTTAQNSSAELLQ